MNCFAALVLVTAVAVATPTHDTGRTPRSGAQSTQAGSTLSVTGVVLDEAHLPLVNVVITVKGAAVIAVSGESGRFAVGMVTIGSKLVFELSGFATREIVVGSTTELRVVMLISALTTDVTVRATAPVAPPDTRIVLRPLDVVRTAGAEADLMRAVGATPGIVRVDEGAGLFVRGGDVSETSVLLNGAVMNHPYRYETPTGGFRGAVDPFLTQGVSFSSGGFAADYANTLSAVLDLQLQDRPAAPQVTATFGLAGVAASAAVPAGAHSGFRVAMNRTTPGLLFAVNTPPREFDVLPHGWDVSGSAHFDRQPFGALHALYIEQRDGVGVKLEQDSFAGFLHSSTSHRFMVTDWRKVLSSGWLASAAIGIDRYTNGVDVGVLAVNTTDGEGSARFDFAGVADAWRIRTGAAFGRSVARMTGFVPTRGGDFGGVSGTSLFVVRHEDMQAGGHAETSRTVGRVTPTVGLRADRFDQSQTWRVDPRVNVSIDAGGLSHIRLAWGRYSQSPSPHYFDLARGATALDPMGATHYIVGYEYGQMTDPWFVRAEAYYKTYRHLPVDEGAGGFIDDGYGYARGLDLFVRRVWHFIDARAAVSVLDARRRWTSPDQRDRYPLPDGTWRPDFAIPFSWQLNVTAPVWRTVSVSASWRTAAGRPTTPATGATPTPDGFEPIWGPINSERMPHYGRVDLSVSHTRTLGRTMLVLFAALDNVGDRENFFEYAYNADYTERHPVVSASPRSVYVGVSIIR